MLTNKTISRWRKQFIIELEKQIGKRYVLGGGQMLAWKEFSNIDENGDPVGFDCCGGIIYAIEQTTGCEVSGKPVQSFLSTPWLTEIQESELAEGDLILVDIPKVDKDGKLLKDEAGNVVYGGYDHVMTYAYKNGYDIITTEGEGGDFRLSPASRTNTRRWTFTAFRDVSARIFSGATRYKFFRINWQWIYNWKNVHQI